MQETIKFVLRMALLALPLVVAQLTNSGYTELAALVSALLVVLDKLVHETKTGALADVKGIAPF